MQKWLKGMVLTKNLLTHTDQITMDENVQMEEELENEKNLMAKANSQGKNYGGYVHKLENYDKVFKPQSPIKRKYAPQKSKHIELLESVRSTKKIKPYHFPVLWDTKSWSTPLSMILKWNEDIVSKSLQQTRTLKIFLINHWLYSYFSLDY